MIKGGYILQPRIIQESDISVAPPYVREIWAYLLRESNSSDNKYGGFTIKRGQLFRSYEDIREGTKWYVGWRKMTYNENHTKKAMKFLRDTQRITTTKELGGVIITICNYDYYQNPKNYDRTTDRTKDRTIAEPLKNQPLPYNNKNDKNDKNGIDITISIPTWRDDFQIYLRECKINWTKYYRDDEFIKRQSELNPQVNVRLSLEKAFSNYWGTESGWKHKKKSRSKEIDWRATMINAIDINKVYYTRQELAEI